MKMIIFIPFIIAVTFMPILYFFIIVVNFIVKDASKVFDITFNRSIHLTTRFFFHVFYPFLL